MWNKGLTDGKRNKRRTWRKAKNRLKEGERPRADILKYLSFQSALQYLFQILFRLLQLLLEIVTINPMHDVPAQQKQLLLGHDSCQQSKPHKKSHMAGGQQLRCWIVSRRTFSDTVTVRAATHHPVRVPLVDLHRTRTAVQRRRDNKWSPECFLVLYFWPSASQLPRLDRCLRSPPSTSLHLSVCFFLFITNVTLLAWLLHKKLWFQLPHSVQK